MMTKTIKKWKKIFWPGPVCGCKFFITTKGQVPSGADLLVMYDPVQRQIPQRWSPKVNRATSKPRLSGGVWRVSDTVATP